MIRTIGAALAATTALTALAAPAVAQPQGFIGQYSDVTVEGSILEPVPVEISDDAELASRITVPDGFDVEVVARNLGNSRILAVHDGHVYASRRTEGDVIRLNDADGDGRYEDFTIVAARPGLHGLALHDDTVYLATVKEVFTAPVEEDGTFGTLTRIIADLPDSGQHPNRTLAIGPDGMLYITVGSTCNACNESNPENATILRASLDGKQRSIFASGLRNTIGFGWHPVTGELYGPDHGTDWLGDEEQQEEFNHIQQGKQYGWPYIFDFSNFNPQDNPPEGLTLAQWAAMSEEPLVGYTAHAAPMQMTFYKGTAFPAEYQGDAFIAMRGSWNRRPPSGYEVTRVDFNAENEPTEWSQFAGGWLLDGQDGEPGGGFGFLARLTGLTETEDGALLLADDFNGILYRISYSGEGGNADGAALGDAPNALPPQPASDIAINLVDTDGALDVSAPAFEADAAIPVGHSAEGHNASPALSWSAGPDGTQSYVVIVDDPDAAEPKPFVHWVLYDVPGTVTMLEEGIATDPTLARPEGARQGANSRGNVGYFGPRPPLEDPAHHYHFQVFALDLPRLPIDAGATKDEVLAAMDGHVLAKGEIVGLFARPAPERPTN